jgi:fructose-specific phosphotransferase system IIB component
MSKIVCVTACPTGIAHTYIAAEMLQKTGKKLGYHMIVETNGAIGIENKLKDDDIKEAIGVIIASDVTIDQKRFDQKKIVEVTTQEAIRHPEEIIKRLVNIV